LVTRSQATGKAGKVFEIEENRNRIYFHRGQTVVFHIQGKQIVYTCRQTQK
jgi:hypothetical protein